MYFLAVTKIACIFLDVTKTDIYIYFLAMYYETHVMPYCAWSSFVELGQVHYNYNLLVLLICVLAWFKPFLLIKAL